MIVAVIVKISRVFNRVDGAAVAEKAREQRESVDREGRSGEGAIGLQIVGDPRGRRLF